MQRPVPAPDHGSLTKHMAFASSRQHGNPTMNKNSQPALPYSINGGLWLQPPAFQVCLSSRTFGAR